MPGEGRCPPQGTASSQARLMPSELSLLLKKSVREKNAMSRKRTFVCFGMEREGSLHHSEAEPNSRRTADSDFLCQLHPELLGCVGAEQLRDGGFVDAGLRQFFDRVPGAGGVVLRIAR